MSIALNKRGHFYIELILLSAVSLFVELLIIRWMSADIRAFSVFKSFPLVACFVGLGAGYALSSDKLFKYTPWAILLFAIAMRVADVTHIGETPFPSLSVYAWQDIFENTSEIWSRFATLSTFVIAMIIPPILAMLCIGSRLGQLFMQAKPLNAYVVNIGGAILGSILFTLASFARLSPAALLVVPTAIIVFYSAKHSYKFLIASAIALVASFFIAAAETPMGEGTVIFWSPYQRIDLFTDVQHLSDGSSFIARYWLSVNKVVYQVAVDVDAVLQKANLLQNSKEQITNLGFFQRRFEFPFKFRKAGDVLILGSGMGNDVAAALKAGADSVDAVDIDPIILELGKKYHPAHPYDSSKVHPICDDARHYIANCKKQYDIIDFSHLDTHTVTAGSSLRLDNYVYTEQNFKQVLKLLKPNGLAIVTFCSPRNWFSERLYRTITQATGYTCELWDKGCGALTVFVFGPDVRPDNFVLPPWVQERFSVVTDHDSGDMRTLTDDWPYLYVKPGLIDVTYLLVMAEIALLALLVANKTLRSATDPYRGQMFFMGAAFMLLELQAISRLSLLFGTTWLTTAIVINGILFMILFANIAVIRLKDKLKNKVGLFYQLLLAFLILSYFTPQLANMLSLGQVFSTIFITTLTLLPICIASIIFAVSFAQVSNAKEVMSFNLFGAFAGSTLEYLSNHMGINALVLIAIVLYALSWKFFPKSALSN